MVFSLKILRSPQNPGIKGLMATESVHNRKNGCHGRAWVTFLVQKPGAGPEHISFHVLRLEVADGFAVLDIQPKSRRGKDYLEADVLRGVVYNLADRTGEWNP